VDIAQISRLLETNCVDAQLYLRPNLTLHQLAKAVGTNRSYLSQYFSRQGITYYIYINNLRFNHFISRYEEATAAGQSVVAQELAYESGFRSHSTFSRAFMQRMGQSVTDWMRDTAE
jgi:AraC-like DNA-binding protein